MKPDADTIVTTHPSNLDWPAEPTACPSCEGNTLYQALLWHKGGWHAFLVCSACLYVKFAPDDPMPGPHQLRD